MRHAGRTVWSRGAPEDQRLTDVPDTSKGPHPRGLLVVVNYNQAPEIGAYLDRAAVAWPIADSIVVDDGSTDSSPDIALARGYRVVRHARNRGVGAAIRSGIRAAQEAGYDFVVINSSNGKMAPEEIPVVVAPLLDGRADYVQGSRFIRPGKGRSVPLFRRAMIPVFSIGASVVLHRRFTDITSGFRAYRLSLFDRPELDLDQDWLDRYELEYYIHFWACRLGLRIVEVPVEISYGHLARSRRTKIRPLVGWWSMARPFILLALGLRR